MWVQHSDCWGYHLVLQICGRCSESYSGYFPNSQIISIELRSVIYKQRHRFFSRWKLISNQKFFENTLNIITKQDNEKINGIFIYIYIYFQLAIGKK